MAIDDLTFARVSEALSYNADTGVVAWKVRRNQNAIPGKPAGNICKTTGYRKIQVDGRTKTAHRLAWLLSYGRYPDGDVDHINGIRTDNRLCNLRELPRHENMQNQRAARSDSKSGILGVHYCAKTNKFRAQIQVRGKKVALGYFDNADEASTAYITAKRAMHAACTI